MEYPKHFKIGVIILIIVAITVILTFFSNVYHPNSFSVEFVGLSMDVPGSSFKMGSEDYNVSSVFNNDHNLSISSINITNVNLNYFRDRFYRDSFYKNKNFSSIVDNNYSLKGVSLYKLGTNYSDSYFKESSNSSNSSNSSDLDHIELKILGDDDIFIKFLKFIEGLNSCICGGLV